MHHLSNFGQRHFGPDPQHDDFPLPRRQLRDGTLHAVGTEHIRRLRLEPFRRRRGLLIFTRPAACSGASLVNRGVSHRRVEPGSYVGRLGRLTHEPDKRLLHHVFSPAAIEPLPRVQDQHGGMRLKPHCELGRIGHSFVALCLLVIDDTGVFFFGLMGEAIFRMNRIVGILVLQATLLCGAAPSTRPAVRTGTAEEAVAALKERFGSKGYRYEIDVEQRLIFAVAAADDAAFDRLRASLKEQAEAFHAELFEHKPDQYVTVLMPTVPDYRRLVKYKNVPGAYIDSLRTLIARDRGFVVTHEFTHALHAADREPLGQAHAVWVIEGLGALSEAAEFTGGKLKFHDNLRFGDLRFSAARKAVIPLERLVVMDQREFVKRPNLTYGQSGSVMLYLWEHKKLREFYETYKATYSEDPTGRVALEKVTGMKLPDFHSEWRQWQAARKGKPAE